MSWQMLARLKWYVIRSECSNLLSMVYYRKAETQLQPKRQNKGNSSLKIHLSLLEPYQALLPKHSDEEHRVLDVVVQSQAIREIPTRIPSLIIHRIVDLTNEMPGSIRRKVSIISWRSKTDTCSRAAEEIAERMGLSLSVSYREGYR